MQQHDDKDDDKPCMHLLEHLILQGIKTVIFLEFANNKNSHVFFYVVCKQLMKSLELDSHFLVGIDKLLQSKLCVTSIFVHGL